MKNIFQILFFLLPFAGMSQIVVETFTCDPQGDIETVNGVRLDTTDNSGTYYIFEGVPCDPPIAPTFSGTSADVNSTKTITILGSFFTASTVVEVPGLTVSNINVVSDSEINFEVTTTATESLYDINIITCDTLNLVDAFEVLILTWVDLRTGGATFTDGNAEGDDIRYYTGMTMTRDATGISFDGANPWASGVKFEGWQWTRGENKKLSWVMTAPTNAMMIGIASTATDETSTQQYNQSETVAYFNSATAFWGLYGNNGTPGGNGNQSSAATVSSTGVFRAEFESDGSIGGTFSLYEIPSAAETDWDDASNLITTFTIAGSLNPDETDIFPYIIPRSASAQRFIAFLVQ